DYSRLKRAFNRGGFTRGYDYGNGKSIMSVKVPNNCGEDIGRIVDKGKGYIKVKTMSDISVGDGIKITRKGVEVGGMQVDKLVYIQDGVKISCNNKSYLVGDNVSITYDKSLSDE
ncbi:MAG: hypothetical protein K2I79_00055, partial [Clostridia bacterium]|nr:hypothetical protein [Clostridia bacterium]